MSAAVFIVSALVPWIAAGPAADAPPLPACPPGWKIEVLAEVPVINHPTVVCCAPDGRVFVAEDPMDISEPADAQLGRILCFHPGGRVTVFAEKLHAVFGMQYLEGELYVLHNPKLTIFSDPLDPSTGAPAPGRIDIIESTNPNPWALDWNDHIPANFKLAMDGYFYLSVGDKGVYQARGRDGNVVSLHGGGVLRLRPDATGLEVFTTGTRNHLDVAINAEDEVFTYDNTDELDWWSRVTHMVDGGYYGYPWDHKPPKTFILTAFVDYGAGAATATLCHEEDALPEEYRGNLFLADWGRREVFRLRIAREGGTYRVASREEFLSRAPADFRPVGLALSPDGTSFYVTDWRHPDVKAKADAGRLLKVSWTGASLAAVKPSWYLPAALGREIDATDEELIASLGHPSQAVRICAQRRIAERGARCLDRLAAVAGDRRSPARARWHAIWALDAIDGGMRARDLMLALLGDRDDSVRMQAARQLGGRRVRAAVPALVGMLMDSGAAVRFRAAAALGRIGDPSAVAPLLAVLAEPDVFARQAIFTALNRIGRGAPAAWDAIVKGLESSDARAREGTLFAMRETFEPGAAAALAAFVRDAARPPGSRAAALDVLSGLHRKEPEWKGEWWAYHPVQLPRPEKTVDWECTGVVLGCLREMIADVAPEVRRAAIDGLMAAKDAGSLKAIEKAFLLETDVEARRSAIRAFTELNHGAVSTTVANLLDGAGDPALAIDAVRYAEQIGGDEMAGAISRLLKGTGTAKDLRLRAIEALGRIGGPGAIEDLAPFLRDGDIALRKAAAASLGATRSKRAFDSLLTAYDGGDEESRIDLARALAVSPDVRALEAYLFGMTQKNAALRGVFRTAITAIQAEAFPEIERRASADRIDPQATLELRRIYAPAKPLRSWKLLAPLPLSTPAPLEDAAAGKTGAWAAVEALDLGMVDLDRVLRPGSREVAYGITELESPSAVSIELVVGSGGPIAVWLNGEKVHETDGDREWSPDQDRVAVRLRQGKNVVLVRTEDLGGGAAFSVKAPIGARGPLFEKDLKEPDPAAYRDFALRVAGDAERGRTLFADTKGAGCVKCHAVKGQGGAVGPDLNGIGSQYDRLQLAESVLYPSRIIRGGFEQVIVITKSGEVKAGAVRGETASELTLVDAEGATSTLRKEEIETRETSGLSLMPEGLTTGLSRQDFADILAYLQSLKS